ATAAAQLMSYWEYPTFWNWAAMKMYANPKQLSITAQQELARLMHEIGENIDMAYGYPESSASTPDLRRYFKKIGYGNSGEYKKYDENKVRQTLLSNIPIIIRGTDSKSRGGHAWVLDGYRTWERTVHVTVRRYGIVALKSGSIRANPNKNYQWVESSYNRIEYLQMVNCNFGWGNTPYNGYYNSRVFNTGAKPAVPGQNAYNGNGFNFDADLHCLYNIKP
ncbi:MAG: C10 family peptidase, partial [Bacteroidales bacterium]|nr:C10 family peptidase [Bacteroidales bacterium]